MSRSSGSTTHSITAVARSAGVSTRTLRHYENVGLLAPTEVGSAGIRRYDDRALVRLQRILLLRSLGLGLEQIRRMLDGEHDDIAALTAHLDWLEKERDRIARQLAAVRATITTLQEGRPMNTNRTFDGFDASRYREEVEERWGRTAWERGASWWSSLDEGGRRGFQAEQRSIAGAAAALAAAAMPTDAPESLALARRQLAWLTAARGGAGPMDVAEFRGLADMYVDDERFTGAYDVAGPGAARALRDAMHALADSGALG